MKYLKITSPDIENGPGCRVTLWIPGCTHKCPGCHNAWTADYNQGKEFDEDAYNELVGTDINTWMKVRDWAGIFDAQNLDLIVTTGLGKDILDRPAAELLGLEVKSMGNILTDDECVVAPAVGTAVMMNKYLI